ncbi:MAG: Hint domain-containing protein [Pseudoruegeria sp.]
MARISELHYSNAYAASSGVSEFLEVALDAGEDPSDFVVSFYYNNGTHGIDIALDHPDVQVTFDANVNEMVYIISADDFPILLTDPNSTSDGNYDSFALTDVSGTNNVVIDYYDIGQDATDMIASGGAADGAVSENLAVLVGPNATTTTLQFNQPDPNELTYGTVNPGDSGIACFVAGTMIQTQSGPRPIETLKAGDLILTQDQDLQPLRWIGQSTVSGTGDFAPIRIRAGAYGNSTDLHVSPQHRMLCTDWRAELMFGAEEVLVAAKFLIDDFNVRPVPCAEVTYVHLMFDQHQIVFANDAPSESYFPGHHTLGELAADTAAEIYALFPDLQTNPKTYGSTARPTLNRSEGALFRIAC